MWRGIAGRKAHEAPSLWGSYSLQGKTIRFVPRFPAEPGVRYVAEFDPARLRSLAKELAPARVLAEPQAKESRVSAEYLIEKPRAEPTTKITAVYPSGERLPENLLRFYIHFSAPMSRGEVYHHLKLIDTSTGKPVHAPFLDSRKSCGRRMPRVSRCFSTQGVSSGAGAARDVRAGARIGQVVLPDHRQGVDRRRRKRPAGGVSPDVSRGPADETMPDPKKWSVKPPRAGSEDALVVRFPEPLDHALLERVVGVRDPEGQGVHGHISIDEHETVWRFVPEALWRAGTYRLVVGTELEDVAGNSVASPFEVDLTTPITRRVVSERVEVPFATRGG